LRRRIARALDLPKGVTVSNLNALDVEREPVGSREAGGAATPTAAITPYLAVSGAQAAIDWYAIALGATPMVGISGGHARATTVPMYRVDDIAAAVSAVRHAGGTATDPEVQPYGTTSTCTDDQGTRFYLGELQRGSPARPPRRRGLSPHP
jgi:uncharacterized glyoxalase superfamily protein PhnB